MKFAVSVLRLHTIRLELIVNGFLMTTTILIVSSISHLVIALNPCVLPD